MSAGDYRELERLYEAGVDAERSRPRSAGLRLMVEACNSVDRSRPLVEAAIAGCKELAALPTVVDVPECPDSVRCASALREVTDLIDEAIGAAETARRTFAEHLGDTPCADALEPPPTYLKGFRTLGRAYEDLAVAVESGDERLADTASDDLARASRQLSKGPSAATSLKRFRVHCSPSG